METPKKPKQIQVFLAKSDMARLQAVVVEHGFESVNLFCKSIILQYLNKEIVLAEMNADSQNVARTMLALTERIESLSRQLSEQSDVIAKHVDGIGNRVDEMVEATTDGYDQTTKLLGLMTRIDKTTDQIHKSVDRTNRYFEQIVSPNESAISDSSNS